MPRPTPVLTPEQLELFTRMFLEGRDRHEMTEALCIYHDRMKIMMAGMSYWQKEARRKNRMKLVARKQVRNVSTREPTAHAMAERERRMNAPRSITAEFFGDPRAGQSALDKRESA
jgi:hypothetical protein